MLSDFFTIDDYAFQVKLNVEIMNSITFFFAEILSTTLLKIRIISRNLISLKRYEFYVSVVDKIIVLLNNVLY